MSDKVRELALAFGLAWAEFIQIAGAEEDNEDNRKKLAARIVALANSGESDLQKLSDAAVLYMRALIAAQKLSRPATNVIGFPFKAKVSASFAPDTVKAMTAALELCLNELPLRVSSEVRDTLTTAILSAASEGETKALELKEAAMRALKTR